MPVALAVAGTDPSGGAGLQADLRTMALHRVYAEGVVTAVVAQNTLGVHRVQLMEADLVRAQLDAVFGDIPPQAVKIGMLGSADIIREVAGVLRQYRPAFVVVDPVMISTSGRRLLNEDACTLLTRELLPLTDLLTPNLAEAEALCGFTVHTRADMLSAAKMLRMRGAQAVLLKGGHLEGSCDDLLDDGGEPLWLSAPRVETRNSHGTGCTLSSAIAAHMALGKELRESVRLAKDYLTGALASGLNLGQGNGPVDHFWSI